MNEPAPEDKKLAKDVFDGVVKVRKDGPPMKPVEQQLAEWVSDAIMFDAGDGMKPRTREEFTNFVKIVPFPPQSLLGYSRIIDITIDTIPVMLSDGTQVPGKLNFDVEIRMG